MKVRDYAVIMPPPPAPASGAGLLPCNKGGAVENHPKTHLGGDVARARARTSPRRAPAPSTAKSMAAGLSKPHIVTNSYPNRILQYFAGCMLLDLQGRAVRMEEGDSHKGGKRAKITEWSKASRIRFLYDMARVLKTAWSLATLITLTYPGEAPLASDFDIYKNHLRVFMQALERRFPGCSGYWKLEFQQRGAPHYHLICFGLNDYELQTIIEWVTQRWYEIAHNGDKNLGVAGTRVERVESGEGAMGYACKYVSKTETTLPDNFTGRYWGRFNQAAIPYGQPEGTELTDHQANQQARILRRLTEKKIEERRWKTFLSPTNPNRSHCWGSRLDWERLDSARHAGAESIKWIQVDSERENGVVEITQRTGAVLGHKPPGKWKARRNSRVRYLGNVDRVMEHLRVGMERGLFPAEPDAKSLAQKRLKTPAWRRLGARKNGNVATKSPAR